MPDYVSQYVRVDQKVVANEEKLEEHAERVELGKYELARIAYEAVTSDTYTPAQFGKAVDKSRETIRRQCQIWAKYGKRHASRRPPYAEAFYEVANDTAEDALGRSRVAAAKAAMRDPELASRVISDPVTRLATHKAVRTHNAQAREREPKTEPVGDNRAFLDAMKDMLRAEQSELRLIANLNQARRNGHLTPAVLREHATKLRLYADAIEEIAGSRGLTDEALAEWIGGS